MATTRVLILGGSGMLGHKLWQELASRFEAYATFRRSVDHYRPYGIFDPERSFGDVVVEDFDSVSRVVVGVKPDVVVNCIGIVKQAPEDHASFIAVNALFPHRLLDVCARMGARLVHVSTDCVFSGRKGTYHEGDVPDGEDLYGRTKLLGEVERGHCLTVRTSFVGRELGGARGLVEWFLDQDGKRVRGFTRATFGGLTTLALADVLAAVIADHPELRGVWHVAGEPITKFDLLSRLRDRCRPGVEIEPDGTVAYDRSLDDRRFRAATGIPTPSWSEMLDRMRSDPTPYDELRSTHARR